MRIVSKRLIIRAAILNCFLAVASASICAAGALHLLAGTLYRTEVASIGLTGITSAIGCRENAKQPAINSRKVTLSWNPSLPTSKSPHGVILGYIVYRSRKSHDLDALPINYARIMGTTFSDLSVEPGKTYYYTARAVDAIGRISGPSNEVRVEIPK